MNATFDRNAPVKVPARFNPVLDIIENWAREDPAAPALISLGPQGEVVLSQSCAELASESRRMANVLLSLGVKKGERVLIMMSRVPAWYTALLGTLRIGAVAIPTPSLCTERDVSYRIQSAEPVAVIADEGAASRICGLLNRSHSVRHWIGWSETGALATGWRNLRALLDGARDTGTPSDPTSCDDPLLIFFTSGTVAYPKMVLHSQSYALGHVVTARDWHGLKPGDRHWTVADTGWAKAAWGSLFGQWFQRATVVQANLTKTSGTAILSILQAQRINSFCAPPTLYRLLVQEDLKRYDLRWLRECTGAGEPLNPEVIRVWEAGTGISIRDGYGQSENTLLVANTLGLKIKLGSMGKPVKGYDVAIVDDQGIPLAPQEVGNIAVRTDPRPVGLFKEYVNNREETNSVFRGDWYFTGDKGLVDEDGYFWFSSRADDVITSSAYRIGPFEVESALIEHPAVQEAAVVGKNDPSRTQIVCAFIILAAGYVPSPELTRELQEHVKRVTAPYKYPREIHYRQELPKTISGKIRRSELRRQLHDIKS